MDTIFNKSGCFYRALDDEPIFVLLARDPVFDEAIRYWVTLRQALIGRGEKPLEDHETLAEAIATASQGHIWRQDATDPAKWLNKPRWKHEDVPARMLVKVPQDRNLPYDEWVEFEKRAQKLGNRFLLGYADGQLLLCENENYRRPGGKVMWGRPIVVPEGMQGMALSEAHDAYMQGQYEKADTLKSEANVDSVACVNRGVVLAKVAIGIASVADWLFSFAQDKDTPAAVEVRNKGDQLRAWSREARDAIPWPEGQEPQYEPQPDTEFHAPGQPGHAAYAASQKERWNVCDSLASPFESDQHKADFSAQLIEVLQDPMFWRVKLDEPFSKMSRLYGKKYAPVIVDFGTGSVAEKVRNALGDKFETVERLAKRMGAEFVPHPNVAFLGSYDGHSVYVSNEAPAKVRCAIMERMRGEGYRANDLGQGMCP